MAYNYLKAIHIIFVVTWFAGLFYMPRLFIYFTEANQKEPVERKILQDQLVVMMRRLWFGITWPSALLTLVLGLWVMFKGGWASSLWQGQAGWLGVKLIFVLFLYGYHFSLHYLNSRLSRYQFRYSSDQLRMWNEVATVFLVAIVILATVKESLSFLRGLAGLAMLVLALLAAIRVYKRLRKSHL